MALAAGIVLALTPAFVRLFRVAGPSDAPSFLTGQTVFVSVMAYDLTIPYTRVRLITWGEPAAGDVILFEHPETGALVFKRVVASSGDTIEMRDHHLVVNGSLLLYEPLDRARFDSLPAENGIGERVEMEHLGTLTHAITWSPDPYAGAAFGPVTVPAGNLFVLGDNRDHSDDSRRFGPIPRRLVRGRVIVRPAERP